MELGNPRSWPILSPKKCVGRVHASLNHTDRSYSQTISIAEVRVDAVTGTIYHAESRPSEEGRTVVVRTVSRGASEPQLEDVFGKEWNARTGVHEYGGAAFAVRDEVVYFTDFKERRIYKVDKNGGVEPVTPSTSIRDYTIRQC